MAKALSIAATGTTDATPSPAPVASQPTATPAPAAPATPDVDERFVTTSGAQPTLQELNARSHLDTIARVQVYDAAHEAAQRAIAAVFGKSKVV